MTKYRFTRENFKPVSVKPLHFDMVFDIQESSVTVTLQATYKYHGTEPLSQIKLNSKGLQVNSVERILEFTPFDQQNIPVHVESFKSLQQEQFKVDSDEHLLLIDVKTPIQSGETFALRTVSVATPTENVLEGLYYDYTPENCPRTIITQCQQYGFQRIVPCIDTMDAKSFYTTTIIADKRYTNLITNGDLAPGYFDSNGLPLYQSAPGGDDKRHVLKYFNHKVCMAPYLFFLGVGTYVTYRRKLEFPDGDTTLLELLCFDGRAEPDHAKEAVRMLHDSIQWVYVSLGPEAMEHEEERKKMYELLEERENLKEKYEPLVVGSTETVMKQDMDAQDTARLAQIRQELKSLVQCWGKTGYKYTGAIYREIAMENSYYGGMENVGNTTIVSSCLCPSATMDDVSYEYMERVKVHEYYHNINGSQVTGQSPFEIWLNEAVTVHMERKRYAHIFGADYTRLHEVTNMFRPALGPLAQDKSPTSLSIEPEGFNQTQELVSVVTYSKAPEFVRMVELILGPATFHQALDLYHTRYSFSNATTNDWISCMEEASGIDLQTLAKTWLKRPGFPEVTYTTAYDADKKEYHVSMTQTGFENKPADNNGPWDIPIDWALVKDGKVMHEGLYRFTTAQDQLVIENVLEKPDFLSFARGWSFFGTSENQSASLEELKLQARTDPDAINRYFAYRMIAEGEKARIVERLLAGDAAGPVALEYVKLHASILFDDSISASTRAITLQEPSSTSRKDLSHHYKEIHAAKKALLQSVWHDQSQKILELYSQLQSACAPGPHKEQLHERALKHHLMNLIALGNSPKQILQSTSGDGSIVNSFALAKELLQSSPFMSDQTVGFRKILEAEEVSERNEMQQKVFQEWSQQPNRLEKYIAVISSLDASDVARQIKELMNSPVYNVNLSHHTRTIARGLSQIRYFSILTDEGLDLMVFVFERIGKVNQMSAYPILKSFDQLDKFDPEMQEKLLKTLRRMQESIDQVKQESLYNQLNIMLTK